MIIYIYQYKHTYTLLIYTYILYIYIYTVYQFHIQCTSVYIRFPRKKMEQKKHKHDHTSRAAECGGSHLPLGSSEAMARPRLTWCHCPRSHQRTLWTGAQLESWSAVYHFGSAFLSKTGGVRMGDFCEICRILKIPRTWFGTAGWPSLRNDAYGTKQKRGGLHTVMVKTHGFSPLKQSKMGVFLEDARCIWRPKSFCTFHLSEVLETQGTKLGYHKTYGLADLGTWEVLLLLWLLLMWYINPT